MYILDPPPSEDDFAASGERDRRAISDTTATSFDAQGTLLLTCWVDVLEL
jgi:hypothetical protein